MNLSELVAPLERQLSIPSAPQPSPWPRPLGDAAFHGLVGEIVRTLEPHTESDPNALLVQFLAAFGNTVSSGPYFLVEQSKHTGRLFVVVVGDSSKARKGTGWSNIESLFEAADPGFKKRIVSGLVSGEGVIWHMRDPGAPSSRGESDPGVTDKRILAVESEFASVLQAAGREKSTLSPVLRDAWDKDQLRTLSKNSAAVATNPHLSIVGHITRPELEKVLSTTDCFNGFANRFLWVGARRSKFLPDGGSLADSERRNLAMRLTLRIDQARKVQRIVRSPEAADRWRKVYPTISESTDGRLGAITSRAEAQILRISIVYALLDGTDTITANHLEAALEVWRYCEDSARFIFGDGLDNPDAQRILQALAENQESGLTRSAISNLFHGHRTKDQLDKALEQLVRKRLANATTEETSGRQAERWRVFVTLAQ